MNTSRADLARNTLGVLFIGILILASAWILQPFVAAIIWATMIVVATWPLMLSVQRWCGGRRGPAVAVMTSAMLVVFLIPLGLAISVIAGHAGEIAAWVQELPGRSLPDAPAWLGGLPVDASCAVSATGSGEFFIRTVLAHEISALIKYRGLSAAEAARQAVRDSLAGIGGDGGVIVVDRHGNVAMEFNTAGMFRGAQSGSRREVEIY